MWGTVTRVRCHTRVGRGMSQAFGALGLTIEVLSGPSGTTPKPRVGQSVALSYTGRLNDSAGTVFDSNESKEPLTVRVGRGQVRR